MKRIGKAESRGKVGHTLKGRKFKGKKVRQSWTDDGKANEGEQQRRSLKGKDRGKGKKDIAERD